MPVCLLICLSICRYSRLILYLRSRWLPEAGRRWKWQTWAGCRSAPKSVCVLSAGLQLPDFSNWAPVVNELKYGSPRLAVRKVRTDSVGAGRPKRFETRLIGFLPLPLKMSVCPVEQDGRLGLCQTTEETILKGGLGIQGERGRGRGKPTPYLPLPLLSSRGEQVGSGSG